MIKYLLYNKYIGIGCSCCRCYCCCCCCLLSLQITNTMLLIIFLGISGLVFILFFSLPRVGFFVFFISVGPKQLPPILPHLLHPPPYLLHLLPIIISFLSVFVCFFLFLLLLFCWLGCLVGDVENDHGNGH